MEAITRWAVFAAAVSSFLLGGVWYGPLFGKAWNAAAGMDDDMAADARRARSHFMNR